ncbi:Retrovirus-related Pol polyprotein from transposon TNT 1-94 [Gossypium australe]|uniref:Retrovirus-related Pol polyprotein from transposon TNT 1-94 n=1 Tax=Gossypium australe TaxID=47621 RepID=A0A5B6WFN1_9ROSI|nr:Retrovirus-related Pol polyprotein from transposon TNT 1-94 [Gossypium australe]
MRLTRCLKIFDPTSHTDVWLLDRKRIHGLFVEFLRFPIALRKGRQYCTYPISSFVSYNQLSRITSSFIALLDSISIPKTVRKALSYLDWGDAMIEEMTTLDGNDTWELVTLLTRKKVMVKVNPDAAPYRWPLHELDTKNIFLHGDPQEEVYIEQPPGFVSLYGLKQSPQAWFERFSEVIQDFGLQKSSCNHSEVVMILLVVYVDGIVITKRDDAGNLALKSFHHTWFQTKDLGQLNYFLGIEVTRSKKGIEDNDSFEDPERYKRLVGKPNFLTITRLDIAYSIRVVSQFMSSPTVKHWAALEQILCYLNRTPSQGPLYQNYGHTSIGCFTDAD